ncbi:MAG: hypothetical protein CVU13_04780 [Bacteroidetes bacterium HGW-Bacteroidetes-8]|jgi:RNA polymerase sigma-70 factor (ECF subfamily)|nr:MAG: hypothetical protein CVU13_04780 [Bacteroidetes bacterium HGW-Bacteroidetes-8]
MVLKLGRAEQFPNAKLFEDIYRRHFKKVVYFAYRYLNDQEKAQNIAQDVFLALWGQMEVLDKNGEVLPYLFILTKYRCLNWLRKEKQHLKFKSNTLTNYDISITALADDSSTSLYHTEIEVLVNEALKKMPDKVKDTFVLSRFKNLKNKEIATLQNISVKTVEYRISFAFRVLRKILKDYVSIVLIMSAKFFC